MSGAFQAFHSSRAANLHAKADVATDIEMREKSQLLKHHSDTSLFGRQIDPACGIKECAFSKFDQP